MASTKKTPRSRARAGKGKTKQPGLSDKQAELGYRGFKPKLKTLAERVSAVKQLATLPPIKGSLETLNSVRANGIDAQARKGIKHSK
jgi:hypothetical protein